MTASLPDELWLVIVARVLEASPRAAGALACTCRGAARAAHTVETEAVAAYDAVRWLSVVAHWLAATRRAPVTIATPPPVYHELRVTVLEYDARAARFAYRRSLWRKRRRGTGLRLVRSPDKDDGGGGEAPAVIGALDPVTTKAASAGALRLHAELLECGVAVHGAAATSGRRPRTLHVEDVERADAGTRYAMRRMARWLAMKTDAR